MTLLYSDIMGERGFGYEKIIVRNAMQSGRMWG